MSKLIFPADVDPHLKQLFDRAVRLLFLNFCHKEDVPGERVVRVGGSGIFVAPFLALTARHVTRDFIKLDWRGELRDPVWSRQNYYFYPEYTANLFQFFGGQAHALWAIDQTWDTPLTDISLLQFSAEAGLAQTVQFETLPFFEWEVLPPSIGSEIIALGFSEMKVDINNGAMNVESKVHIKKAKVTQVFPNRRDAGLITFPAFEIDVTLDHGCSGGPVFHNDRLCGIISGDSHGTERSAIASLWPLTQMKYGYSDVREELRAEQQFGDLLDSGVIKSADWPSTKERITKEVDENDTPRASLKA
jgi:hypothetical protein